MKKVHTRALTTSSMRVLQGRLHKYAAVPSLKAITNMFTHSAIKKIKDHNNNSYIQHNLLGSKEEVLKSRNIVHKANKRSPSKRFPEACYQKEIERWNEHTIIKSGRCFPHSLNYLKISHYNPGVILDNS